MSRVLLVNPSYQRSYDWSYASLVNPIHPTLGLLMTAAAARARGHRVEILDLSYRRYDYRLVEERLRKDKPDVVGITCTTPLMNQARDISVLAKSVSRDIRVVAGGTHVSSLPLESLRESLFDVVVVGEGETTFGEIVDGRPLADIRGICYRDGDDIRATPPRPFLRNLDELPLPAYDLYDARDYRGRISRLLARRTPLALLEFSRGCVFQCDFCASKNTLGLGLRKKSKERCAEEARLVRALGYPEFALADDIFTSDREWAASVCGELRKNRMDVLWTCTNGIRVESADEGLFRGMRAAGCYRVSFGFESGSNEVLRAFGKGGRASLEEGRRAVRSARRAGLETNGYFLLGLSADTERTMENTIAFARDLDLDVLKFGITIAFPGTPMFRNYHERGLIRSYDWDRYFVYTEEALFAHPRLDFETIRRCRDRAYREAIWKNPRFLYRRLARGLFSGRFFWDAYYALKFLFHIALPNRRKPEKYFARGSWPRYDFAKRPIRFMPVRKA